jgi:hypothetical protein
LYINFVFYLSAKRAREPIFFERQFAEKAIILPEFTTVGTEKEFCIYHPSAGHAAADELCPGADYPDQFLEGCLAAFYFFHAVFHQHVHAVGACRVVSPNLSGGIRESCGTAASGAVSVLQFPHIFRTRRCAMTASRADAII